MKKACHFLLLIPFLFFSQTSLLGQNSFGVKAGISLADIDIKSKNLLVSKNYQYTSLPTWHFGVTAGFSMGRSFSIQPELLLSQKGAQSHYEPPLTLEHTYKYKMLYFTLPVLLQYKFGPITLEAGPEIGYMLTNKTIIDGESTKDLFSIFGNKKLDVSTNLGFKFTVKNIFTQVRWQYSLLSIADVQVTDANGEFIGNYDYYHNAISVSLGYLFVK